MAKELSSKTPTFAKGGKTKMFGKQHAGPQVPGGSATKTSGSGGKFIKGGGKKMFGFSPTKAAKAGSSAAR